MNRVPVTLIRHLTLKLFDEPSRAANQLCPYSRLRGHERCRIRVDRHSKLIVLDENGDGQFNKFVGAGQGDEENKGKRGPGA